MEAAGPIGIMRHLKLRVPPSLTRSLPASSRTRPPAHDGNAAYDAIFYPSASQDPSRPSHEVRLSPLLIRQFDGGLIRSAMRALSRCSKSWMVRRLASCRDDQPSHHPCPVRVGFNPGEVGLVRAFRLRAAMERKQRSYLSQAIGSKTVVGTGGTLGIAM